MYKNLLTLLFLSQLYKTPAECLHMGHSHQAATFRRHCFHPSAVGYTHPTLHDCSLFPLNQFAANKTGEEANAWSNPPNRCYGCSTTQRHACLVPGPAATVRSEFCFGGKHHTSTHRSLRCRASSASLHFQRRNSALTDNLPCEGTND